MSKQEMARLLIARGSKLAFNTLRKYSVERLESMLAAQHASNISAPLSALRHHVTGAIERGEAEAIVEKPVAPYIPTDRELYAAALPQACEPQPVAPPASSSQLVALCVAPFALIGVLFGLWQD